MAGCVQLAALTFFSTLAIIKPSYGLTKDNSMRNFSEEISRWALETSKVEASNIPPWTPGNNEDIVLSKPPARISGSLMTENNISENVENIPNEFQNDLKINNKMDQMPSSGIVVTTSKAPMPTHLEIHPTMSRSSDGDTGNKTGNKVPHEEHMELTHMRPFSQMVEEDLQLNNNVVKDNLEENDIKTLTTVRPTVSTITLISTAMLKSHMGDDGPFTPIHKLQIDSNDKQVTKELLKNSLGAQDDPAKSQEPKVTLEDNFLDDNTIPKVQGLQPTERYRAAFRTTDGYSALQDAEPESNEVISADIEFAHEDGGVHYQKDGNTVFAESMNLGNDTEGQHSSKEIVSAGVQVPNIALSTEPHNEPQPPTSLSTLHPVDMESDILQATMDITDPITMEAKARTETERILIFEGDQDRRATDTFPVSSRKTNLQEVMLTSPQSNETPTPAMQVLGKNSEAERPSTQPGKLTPLTQRNPIIGSLPPGLVMSTTWKMLVTKQPDPLLDISRSEETSTSKVSQNETRKNGRRGEIRVTTQRALHRPQLLDVPTYNPSKKPTLDTPMCSKNTGTCEYVGANQTLLKWDDLQRTLSFAWNMHVYGTGALFLLLSVIALINLIGSPILRVSYLPYVILANALLFVIGVLRGVFFLLDPYGTKMKITQPIALILYNITFPLMLTAFATLVLLVLKISRLQVLPPKFQSLALLAVIAVIHFIVLISADLLTHLLNPSVNMVLQILSISWGIFLMVGNFVAYYQLRKSSKEIVNETQRVSPTGEDIVVVQSQGRNIKCIFTSSRVLLVGSIFGLLCCALQVYAILWLYGLLGKKNEFSWSWWFLQFWFRIFELALCFSMIFVASHSFCLQCSSNDHTCWSKIISYFCTYKKNDAPEYPNNCYEWTNSIQDRMVNNNISKTLIRNQAENVPLRILKENNEAKSNATMGNNSQSSSPLFKPKPDSVFGPKSQNVTMGRSYTSICFEKESMLSLTDLEFRPPSPINLSRSIDEALFREHLVRDSIFLDSSLQYPSYLTRQDSCSSLKESSALNQTVDPLISADLKMRRCSNPDHMYSMAKCSSTTEVDTPSESLQQSKELPRDLTTDAVVSVSSMDSVSKGSIKISWNPWRHGLSSVESLPLEDAPTTQLLKQGSQPSIMSKSSEPEKSFGRRLIERSQTIDSHSIASETIEL
ncbi:proline-rich transmembrane protein 3 [Hyla sarda]|uniref:proline-rich transmembrane protein 3 n=1 Tax=Hyla sarda TaxID=327740 RepID=UPI0024C30C3C|nr:proline-rich transmembrane protein 3 [Hyla sarda]XP_056380708.1 proline-rich transmembrane protein 3 [Hyla sarda]XP_056380709.1 proline-rich transmembrane protein 3 [Hyla sarda]XP_056380710.1 proline-rich transmembrane protein 3 [Hyla sarda]